MLCVLSSASGINYCNVMCIILVHIIIYIGVLGKSVDHLILKFVEFLEFESASTYV